eukprot:641341-Karenia_brevis.AAC.1
MDCSERMVQEVHAGYQSATVEREILFQQQLCDLNEQVKALKHLHSCEIQRLHKIIEASAHTSCSGDGGG